MKLGAAEAVAINGPPSNDGSDRGSGDAMADGGGEESFMAAVSTAYNAQSCLLYTSPSPRD